jgi:hypothetical protein
VLFRSGNNSQAYTISISNGSQAEDVLISNLGNMFSGTVKGHSPHSAPDKFDIEDYNVMTKSGEFYNVTGMITLTGGNIMNVTYTLSPVGTTACGIITGNGTGVKM